MTVIDEYTYAQSLHGSADNAWTVDDCFQGRDFDFSKPFLPDRIAGVNDITCLDAGEKLKLNQIRGNSYCHLFAFIEEYIVPMVLERACSDVYGDETRLWSLLWFAEEEVKHQQMLGRACDQFDAGFGVACGRLPGQEDVARVVVGAGPFTALLLTSMIEWFTQSHFLEHVRDREELDALFRDIVRFHWIDESRHARLDSLMLRELAATVPLDERERAVDQLLELGTAVDGLLAQQMELDIEALERACGRHFSDDEQNEIREQQRRSYRWTFLVSGLEHPKFVEVVSELTETGAAKIAAAAQSLP
jgi:hypothetical protein